MLGDAGLHQTAVQKLRTLLLTAQSDNIGGFVAQRDGLPGMIVTSTACVQFKLLSLLT